MRFAICVLVLWIAGITNARAQDVKVIVESGKKPGEITFVLLAPANRDLALCLIREEGALAAKELPGGILAVPVRRDDCSRTRAGRATWSFTVPRGEWNEVKDIFFAVVPLDSPVMPLHPQAIQYKIGRDGKARQVHPNEQNI